MTRSLEYQPKQHPIKDTVSRLPEAARAFVQCAFAEGVAEKIDGFMQFRTPLGRRNWEKQKWLLVRYVVDDLSALDDVKKYAGVQSSQGALMAYKRALEFLWWYSPEKLREKFSEEEVFKGKKQGMSGSPTETTTPPTAATEQASAQDGRRRPRSEETKANISAALSGRVLSDDTRKKMKEAAIKRAELWRLKKAQRMY